MFLKSILGAFLSFLSGLSVLRLSVNYESYLLLIGGLALFTVSLYFTFFRIMDETRPAEQNRL